MDLSDAILSFLGYGVSPSPTANQEFLERKFGKENGEAVGLEILRLTREIMSIEIDWSNHTLASASVEASRIMRDRHPELTDEAIQALGWQFSFAWR